VIPDSRERAVLVAAGEDRQVGELGRLAGTLGVEVAATLEQGRRDGAGYLGRGKREELRELVEKAGATLVIADDELTASQARVLEKAAGAEVVDRTELIIRIFEEHARDAASRLEVELADLEYRLPRVKGRNPALSRLGGGGVTTRGPGEQQLEYDRRAIRRRIQTIHRRLREERSSRSVRGARLREGGPPTVALVGYTNAGKTTILNALSGAGRPTKDRLFETLETTTRVVEGRADGKVARPDFVVTDTVGFIRKMPEQLVHSFEGTREAARDADVLVLCADASSPQLEEELATVRRILFGEEPADKAGAVLCLNKVDAVPESRLAELRREYPDAVEVSAISGDVTPLLEAVYRALAAETERVELLIPHAEYPAASRLYGRAEIHSSASTPEGVRLDVSLPPELAGRYAPYRET
jgi:GTPase